MKSKLFTVIAASLAIWATPSAAQSVHTGPWVLGYYLSGDSTGRLPVSEIDFRAMTHLIHFGLFPNADGSLDQNRGGINAANAAEVVAAAHAAGCKVLVCLGSDEGGVKLRRALLPPARPLLVRTLARFVVEHGYDGLDIDMEPLEQSDVAQYEPFIRELRQALDSSAPGLVLTAAVAGVPEMFARLQQQFDQIDLMTYDLSGPWPGFRTWYNACLFSPREKMNATEPFPSVSAMVDQYVKAGVARGKLGIGIAFYGYVWNGVDGPKQPQSGGKVDDGVDYRVIMDTLYRKDRYHWDSAAHAPWLSVRSLTPSERKFVSYDDERLAAEKIRYVRSTGLGGAIIWELGAGYRPQLPPGRRDGMLQAVKRALLRKP